jgi:hypothetical protein
LWALSIANAGGTDRVHTGFRGEGCRNIALPPIGSAIPIDKRRNAMKWLCAVVVLIGLVCVHGVKAETGFGTAAIVITVDANTKTITFKHTDSNGAWKQTAATWDEKTTWKRAEKEIWDETPATAAVAKDLKKDSKIYVIVNDRGGKTFWIEQLKTIPPTFEVK